MATGYKTGGRKKGTPNKTTHNVKIALREAFEEMGGVCALVTWAQHNPTEFYKIWARMLPRDIGNTETLEDGNPFHITFNMGDPPAMNSKKPASEVEAIAYIEQKASEIRAGR